MKEIEKLHIRPFTRFCMSIGAVPSSYLAGLTIEEQLLWLCSYLEKEVIPAVNNNAEAVEELQNLFTELQTYVNNYFDNLDVQDEINNKLDDMAESGELEEIIASYLNTKAILCFDTMSDLLSSVNLIDGSYAKTCGFYAVNDGGSGLYKIRELEENETADDTFTFLTDSGLIAELIIFDKVSLSQIGCKKDGSELCDTKIYNAINKFKDGGTIFIPTGEFLVSHISIDFEITNLNIIGSGFESCLSNETTAWTFEFLQKISDVYLDKFQISCNHLAYGIKITNPTSGSNVRVRINDVNIRHARKGFYIEDVVYLDMKKTQIGITNSNSDYVDNYAMYYDGYEYNTFDSCSFDGDYESTFPLVIIHQANWLNFINCEFTKGGTGIIFDTTNIAQTCREININLCKFYNLLTGIEFKLNTRGFSDVKIMQNAFYNRGTSNTERFMKVSHLNSSTQKIMNLMVNDNNFEKIGTTGMAYAIECEDDTLYNSGFLNNLANYNTQNYMSLGNNVPSAFSDLNIQRVRNTTITANGSTATFTIYNNNNQLPLLPRQPFFVVNIPELNIAYSVNSYYEQSNPLQLRGKITFASNPPAGTYNVYYNLIY